MFPEYEYRNTSLLVTAGKNQSTYPVRFHKHVEIAFVKTGFMDVTIDGHPYSLHQGDLYIVFPNLPHSISLSDATKCLIMVSPELFSSLGDTLSRCKPTCPVLRKEDLTPFLEQLCDRMDALCREDFRKNYPTLVCYANALLSELMLKLHLEERKSDSDLVQQLVLHLLENYTEEITLEQVADALGYSKYHVSHVIADTFGCNFRTLVNSYRISMAQNLMLSTDKGIGEVAFQCGFHNQSSFNRIFLKHCGMTPSQFRGREDPTAAEQPHLIMK